MLNINKRHLFLFISVMAIFCVVNGLLSTDDDLQNRDKNNNIKEGNFFKNNLDISFNWFGHITVEAFSNLTRKEKSDLKNNLNDYTVDINVLDKRGEILDSSSGYLDGYSNSLLNVEYGDKVQFPFSPLVINDINDVKKVIVIIKSDSGVVVQTIEKNVNW